MKHPIILPALISLTLSSSWLFAEEPAPQDPQTAPATADPAVASATTPATEAETKAPENTPYARHMEMMQKHAEHRKEMQEYMDKLSNAKTPEEREKLADEYDQMMQKHWEEMNKLRGGYAPWGEDSEDMMPPPPPPYAYGPYGPGPRWGYPGGYGRGYGPRPRNFSGGGMPPQPPFVNVEQHLQKIEKLLTEIKEALPEKAK